MEILNNVSVGVSSIATALGASDFIQFIQATGDISVPSLVITVLNSVILIINAGIAIYKKIKALKDNDKEAEKKEGDKSNNGIDSGTES